jgi:hypothetical protein
MTKHNYTLSPRNRYIHCSEVEGTFCGSNGQCCKCSEWVGNVNHYVELIRDELGYAICPKCGDSYGKVALTGDEYKREVA